jgi:hypothetical protein
MLFQNDAGARVTFGYACFALFTHPHAVEQRSYLPAIVKRCPWIFGAVKERPPTAQGPKIEVPRALDRYWSWVKRPAGGGGYRFDNLGKVEILRFVELCKSYSSDESLRGMRLIDRMLPLDEWEPRRWSGNGGDARKGRETS